MTPKEYQTAVTRTQPDENQERAQVLTASQLISQTHAIIGLCTEVGELQDAFKKTIFYGRPLDKINVKEEVGDICWYLAFLCNEMGFDLGEIMSDNIAKLKKRYPEKFTEADAQERKDKQEGEQ